MMLTNIELAKLVMSDTEPYIDRDILADIQQLAVAVLANAQGEAVALSELDIKIHMHDCPKIWGFFNKHAIGSKVCPSCLACGKPSLIHGDGAIRHMELPDIYICKYCAAILSAHPAPSALPDSLPDEPTEEMIDAMCKAATDCEWPQDFGKTAIEARQKHARAAYKAMLRAHMGRK